MLAQRSGIWCGDAVEAMAMDGGTRSRQGPGRVGVVAVGKDLGHGHGRRERRGLGERGPALRSDVTRIGSLNLRVVRVDSPTFSRDTF